MRLKNVPGSQEEIAASPYAVTDPEAYAGRWQTLFPAPQPLFVEIGMGKGKFLVEQAHRHPEINFLGLEKYSSVLVRAVQKQEEEQLANLFFVRADAEYLTEYFAAAEIDRIYLNFSDPWPKDRHAKRRLTSDRFLARYDIVLKPKGQIEFKTDNTDLFDFSVASVTDFGWELPVVTRDLHASPWNEGNVMTEYEEKFSAAGSPICKLIARRSQGSAPVAELFREGPENG